MTSTRRAIFIVFALLLPFLFSGCAAVLVEQSKQKISDRIDPLLGSSQETVIQELGAPNKVATIAGMEIWEYYQSYGARGNAYANASYGNAWGTSQQWEMYDKTSLYFKDGTLVKWDGYVQR